MAIKHPQTAANHRDGRAGETADQQEKGRTAAEGRKHPGHSHNPLAAISCRDQSPQGCSWWPVRPSSVLSAQGSALLWILMIAFVPLGFATGIIEGNVRWYGVGIGVVDLVLLLPPDTRRFFRREEIPAEA